MNSLVLQALVGFVGVLSGTAVSWGYMKAKVEEHEKRLDSGEKEHQRIDDVLTVHGQSIAVLQERTRAKSAGWEQ